jgi:hypothetical protein
MDFLDFQFKENSFNISYVPRQILESDESKESKEDDPKGKGKQKAYKKSNQEAKKQPKVIGAPPRPFELIRSKTTVGKSPILPLLFVEDQFWKKTECWFLQDGIAEADKDGMESGDLFDKAKNKISDNSWTHIRNNGHEKCVMVGCMLVKFSYHCAHHSPLQESTGWRIRNPGFHPLWDKCGGMGYRGKGRRPSRPELGRPKA